MAVQWTRSGKTSSWPLFFSWIRSLIWFTRHLKKVPAQWLKLIFFNELVPSPVQSGCTAAPRAQGLQREDGRWSNSRERPALLCHLSICSQSCFLCIKLLCLMFYLIWYIFSLAEDENWHFSCLYCNKKLNIDMASCSFPSVRYG